jgi:hypothetical protein
LQGRSRKLERLFFAVNVSMETFPFDEVAMKTPTPSNEGYFIFAGEAKYAILPH